MPGPAEDEPLTRRGNAYHEVLFGYDSDYAYAVNIVKSLYLGPGEPGPGDKWNMPRGPLDEAGVEAGDGAEEASSSYGGWHGRLIGLFRRQPPE
jgi:hypothetical protein